jgi:pyruvate dehydrogenase E2 component (dihydrolipoamide acetyltransferase)
MPSLGADMEKGTIVEWRVAPGDAVVRGDIVAVVSTEKADIEIETFETGTVGELLASIGDEVPVGTVIATIVGAGAASSERIVSAPRDRAAVPTSPVVDATKPAPQPTRAVAPHETFNRLERPRVSPRARRRAAALGVDLASIVEAARGRAVTTDDVERAAQISPRVDETPSSPVKGVGGRTVDAVGRLMAQSKRDIPHFYVSEDIDVSQALVWMDRRNEAVPVEQRLLPAALLLRAVVLALRDVPELNARLVDGEISRSSTVELAVAISQRGGGLVAPVIRGADSLDLDALMDALKGVVTRARSGSLRSSDVDLATITVTNLGDQGAGAVWGVIVPPQVAIVGFGRITERPWAVDGMLTVRGAVTATLSADHRASHGHQGARFLRAIARALENPEALT